MTSRAAHIPTCSIEFDDSTFDDVDALAASARQWHQEYEQIGRGPFRGRLSQMIAGDVQLGREQWTTGLVQRGTAPMGTWAFAIPIRSSGSLHLRRRPVHPNQLLASPGHEDIGFAATGAIDMVVAVLPTGLIDRWFRARHGVDHASSSVLLSGQYVPPRIDTAKRAALLTRLLRELTELMQRQMTSPLVAHVQDRIVSAILSSFDSAGRAGGSPRRALSARLLLDTLLEHRESPPSMTRLCELTGATERTLHLSSVEAFGCPPGQLLLALRLNAARRVLSRADAARVTDVASRYGFTHLGRFSSMYARQFGELPSATLAAAAGRRETGRPEGLR